jgi:hypothetical protein
MERIDRGGLRWGESYWRAKNVTWPFATLTVRDNYLEVDSAFPFPLFSANFIFVPKDVSALRPYRGFIRRGIQVEHFRRDYPSFIVFWSFFPARTLADAKVAGYTISN